MASARATDRPRSGFYLDATDDSGGNVEQPRHDQRADESENAVEDRQEDDRAHTEQRGHGTGAVGIGSGEAAGHRNQRHQTASNQADHHVPEFRPLWRPTGTYTGNRHRSLLCARVRSGGE